MKKIVIHVFVNVLLIAIYIQFFGYQSMKRYIDKGINTITTEEKDSAISPFGKNMSYIIM